MRGEGGRGEEEAEEARRELWRLSSIAGQQVRHPDPPARTGLSNPVFRAPFVTVRTATTCRQ